MVPVIALAAAVSGLTKYRFASAVPDLPLKLRLKVRSETPAELGANPMPMHGPQALSKILKPARIRSPKMPALSAISNVVRLPGAMPASTPGAICLPFTMEATDSRSSSELFVQLPIATCVTGIPFSSETAFTASGECGHAARADSSVRLISITLSYTASLSAVCSVQSAARPMLSRNFFVVLSEGNTEHVAPSSAPMLVTVARCGTVRLSTPSPKYSYTAPTPPLTVSRRRTSRMISLAPIPLRSVPVSFTPKTFGMAR